MEIHYKESWMLILHAAHALRDHGMCHARNADKVTLAQEKILAVVFEHPEGVMQKDIASELKLTPGAVSQSIETLVREGLLERFPSPTDRRAVSIRPSERCRLLREKMYDHFTRFMESVLDEVGESDRRAFVGVLNRIIEKAASGGIDSSAVSARRVLLMEE